MFIFRFCVRVLDGKEPKTLIETLHICDQKFYPTVHQYLQISATLPVSAAPSERSFSSLRKLKTNLRNSTGQTRLNGLALLNIHRDIEVSSEEIIDIMATVPRRLDIVL